MSHRQSLVGSRVSTSQGPSRGRHTHTHPQHAGAESPTVRASPRVRPALTRPVVIELLASHASSRKELTLIRDCVNAARRRHDRSSLQPPHNVEASLGGLLLPPGPVKALVARITDAGPFVDTPVFWVSRLSARAAIAREYASLSVPAASG